MFERDEAIGFFSCQILISLLSSCCLWLHCKALSVVRWIPTLINFNNRYDEQILSISFFVIIVSVT